MTIIDPSEVLDDLGLENADPADIRRMSRSIMSAQRAIEEYLGYLLERETHTEYYPIARQRSARDSFVDVIGQRVLLGREGDSALIIANRPVINDDTLAVYESFNGQSGQSTSAFPAASLLTKGSDYFLDVIGNEDYSMSGILYRRAGTWSPEIGSIMVIYSAGFTAADLNGTGTFKRAAVIKDSLFEEAKRDFRQRRANAANLDRAAPLSSESIGQYSYSAGGGNAKEIANVLELSHAAKMRLHRWRKLGGRFA